MKRGGGKNKGNRFENQVAKTFSRWLTAGEDATQIIPSRGSGGWQAKGGVEQAWRHVGDLAPNGEHGEEFRRHFAVECKHHREILFWHWLTQTPGENIAGWFLALMKEIEAAGAVPEPAPLLIFTQNHKPIMVATLPGIYRSASGEKEPTLILSGHGIRIAVSTLDDFLLLSPAACYQAVSNVMGSGA